MSVMFAWLLRGIGAVAAAAGLLCGLEWAFGWHVRRAVKPGTRILP